MGFGDAVLSSLLTTLPLPALEPWQWILGACAALLVGFGKTGVPGLGVVVVPIMVVVFGGKPSVGALLPLLIAADCLAVWWYRRHAQWDRLWGLFPWVLPGIIGGAIILWAVDAGQPLGGEAELAGLPSDAHGSGYSEPASAATDWFKPLIGMVVLAMVLLHVLRQRLGERLTPRPGLGMAAAGSGAGLATTLANAAGPIMMLYLAAKRLPKEQFMGTNAWFFLLLNVAKVPVYIVISQLAPHNAMITISSLTWNALMLPLIAIGAVIGKWFFPKISQPVFDWLIIVGASLAAVKLIIG